MLTLPAVLTHSEASACLATLLPELRRTAGQSVCADASALQRFDSSALAVLLACRREALNQGKVLTVAGLPDRLHALAILYGVAELLPIASAAH